MTTYAQFLESKARRVAPAGIEPGDVHPGLFAHQAHLVRWALRRGRAALFADTGLGKTRMQVEWARQLGARTLILAPLAVTRQTMREAAAIDIEVVYARSEDEASPAGITITNYERMDRFDPSDFGAVVLDECFPPGTLIDAPDGARPIEDFRIGRAEFDQSLLLVDLQAEAEKHG